jgi:hypothetical protein
MPMLAELVDAVVGVDTHRDTHQVEIALPNGAPIAVTTISNDTTGYAQLLARIVEHAPGPRVGTVEDVSGMIPAPDSAPGSPLQARSRLLSACDWIGAARHREPSL